jgi:hypothetical protein
MLTYRINTLEDAYALVARYKLDTIDWGHGTAEGFALMLFLSGMVEDVGVLAGMVEEYKEACELRASEGLSRNEELARDTEGTCEALQDVAEARGKLAAFVRKTKFGPHGGAVWAAIAKLATTATTDRLELAPESPRLLARIRDVLTGAREFESDFFNAVHEMEYAPGENEFLDTLVRMDIERLDTTLTQAPAWPGREDQYSFEVNAFLQLALDVTFMAVLDSRIDTPEMAVMATP